MTPKVKMLYKHSIKNKEFIDDLWIADADRPPSSFSCEVTKIIFAGLYYGWLVGKHGKRWQEAMENLYK